MKRKKGKNIIIPVIAVLVLGSLSIYVLALKNTKQIPDKPAVQEDSNTVMKLFAGVITEIEGSTISMTLLDSSENRLVEVSDETLLGRQTEDEDKNFKILDINLSELRKGEKIVVGYYDEPINGVYKAADIQIHLKDKK